MLPPILPPPYMQVPDQSIRHAIVDHDADDCVRRLLAVEQHLHGEAMEIGAFGAEGLVGRRGGQYGEEGAVRWGHGSW